MTRFLLALVYATLTLVCQAQGVKPQKPSDRSTLNAVLSFPNKLLTQRTGIVPDVEVKPTIAGIRAGRDEVLEAALRQILGTQVPPTDIENMVKP